MMAEFERMHKFLVQTNWIDDGFITRVSLHMRLQQCITSTFWGPNFS